VDLSQIPKIQDPLSLLRVALNLFKKGKKAVVEANESKEG
jgi:hypothetical protein